jgi:5-methyltetrahydrofolate--homocysteine methyltransferase
MSGLLVKSAAVMRENLAEMARQGLTVPVLLGGAALTRRYVEEDCASSYGAGAVAYARDAFDGLALMDQVASKSFADNAQAARKARKAKPQNRTRALGRACDAAAAALRPIDLEESRLRRAELSRGLAVPAPPFWGTHVVDDVPVRELLPYLNERMLYQFHWGYRKDGRSLAEYMVWARTELRPILDKLLDRVIAEDILRPQAVYGYFPCAAEGNDVILYGEDGRKLARFGFPRQAKEGGLCIADFFRDASDNTRDVIGLQAVTIGQNASDTARGWFAEDLAEAIHAKIRAELGFADPAAPDADALSRQAYRGSRYSFGYPACPNLADQRPLLELLGAERIGLTISEEDQLEPEQSTSAIVVIHPQAKYFSV